MKNLLVIVGVLILLGVIVLFLLPERIPSSVTNVSDNAPPQEEAGEPATTVESETSADIEYSAEGGSDAGMEFPTI